MGIKCSMQTHAENTSQVAQEKIFFHGSDYFAALLADIENAKESIELETFIFAFDDLGLKILSALTSAVKRKVRVRLLLDGAGTYDADKKAIRTFEDAGGEARIFHPFPWNIWQWSRSVVKKSTLLKAIYLLLKMNSRNHRKVCLIDNKIAYVGSFNICQDHLEDFRRDTGVRIAQINFQELSKAFDASWSHVRVRERVRDYFRQVRSNPIIRLNNTRHRRRILHKNLLRRIRQCKRRIWITNAYFVPDNMLLRRLRKAAKFGIDVRILLPQKSDVAFMPWASKTFYARLLKAGVHIYEYVPGILHAKTLIIDNWMLIGSSNLNHRSILHDLEVDINIRSPESKKALEQQFLNDLKNSSEVYYEDWKNRPFYQRVIGKLLLYVKYMI
jgi:cardiolipin synthase A/B